MGAATIRRVRETHHARPVVVRFTHPTQIHNLGANRDILGIEQSSPALLGRGPQFASSLQADDAVPAEGGGKESSAPSAGRFAAI